MSNHVIGTGKRLVVSSNGGATKDMAAAASTARRYAHLSPSMGGSSTARNGETAGLGTKKETATISSHNSQEKATSGISMHHPYKPRGGAFDTRKKAAGNVPSTRDFKTASGGGTGKVAGKKVSEVMAIDNYNNPKVENSQPKNVTSKSPSGPKGGIRAVMNRMAKVS